MASKALSTDDVFINCPFDQQYADIFRALTFAIYACGFRPRCALELDDGGQARIEKIFAIIGECRYGIHDLSRTELDEAHGLPRFNMPLELGIFIGAKRYGAAPQKQKRLLILDTERYRFQRFISDLAGMDIHEHRGEPTRAVREARVWLANVSRRALPSGDRVVRLYEAFLDDLPRLANEFASDPATLAYSDFERLVAGWLLQAPGGA